jgi:hypothetical protein
MLGRLREREANLSVESGRQAVAEASRLLEGRGVIVVEPNRYRVRNRSLLRYYARTIEHLFAPAHSRIH